MKYYIASCVFTEKHPALSDKIQAYARRRGMSVVRCCVSGYKVHEFEARMHPALSRELAGAAALRRFWAGGCGLFHLSQLPEHHRRDQVGGGRVFNLGSHCGRS